MENDQSCGRSGQKKQELEALEIQGLEVKIVRQVTILEGHHRLKGSQANYTAFLFLYFFVEQFAHGLRRWLFLTKLCRTVFQRKGIGWVEQLLYMHKL